MISWTASATWLVTSAFAPEIRINDPLASNLTETVLIQGGTLKCNEDLDTTGDLHMTGGKIEVASGKCAQFD